MNQEFTIKEVILQMINICTRVVTMIFVIATLTMQLTDKSFTALRTCDIWCIILIGVVAALLYLIYIIPKKIGKKLMIVLETIYFLSINATVLLIGAKLRWYNPANKLSFIIMEGMIILIYIIVFVSCYVFDYQKANKMNDLLKQRKLKKTNNEA